MGSTKFGWKHRPIPDQKDFRTVGIMGVSHGCGTTHMSILTAHYLSGVLGKNTALVEFNRQGDFERIQQIWLEDGKIPESGDDSYGVSFCLNGIDYYPNAGMEELLSCFHGAYDGIVIDFGCDYTKGRGEFLRCTRKLVIGSVSGWHRQAMENFIGMTEDEFRSDWKYGAVFGSEGERTRLRKKTGLTIHPIPFMADAHCIGQEAMTFYRRILL